LLLLFILSIFLNNKANYYKEYPVDAVVEGNNKNLF